MPVTILTNSCTPLGLVNALPQALWSTPQVRFSTADGQIHVPSHNLQYLGTIADFFEIDDLYLLCTKPKLSTNYAVSLGSPILIGYTLPILGWLSSLESWYRKRQRKIEQCYPWCRAVAPRSSF